MIYPLGQILADYGADVKYGNCSKSKSVTPEIKLGVFTPSSEIIVLCLNYYSGNHQAAKKTIKYFCLNSDFCANWLECLISK